MAYIITYNRNLLIYTIIYLVADRGQRSRALLPVVLYIEKELKRHKKMYASKIYLHICNIRLRINVYIKILISGSFPPPFFTWILLSKPPPKKSLWAWSMFTKRWKKRSKRVEGQQRQAFEARKPWTKKVSTSELHVIRPRDSLLLSLPLL